MKTRQLMRPIVLIMTLLVLSRPLCAQGNYIHVSVAPAVDTANHALASVIKVWEQYLNSNPDSAYVNPYWVDSEQRQYKPFDLAAHTWWGQSMYAMLSRWKTTVLSVSPVGDSFVIRTMFYVSSPNDLGMVSVVSIVQTGARLENGAYKLCNVLPINTRYWKRQQVGSITFTFPPDHEFDHKLAERMSRFIDSLAVAWQIAVVPTEYYFADDIDRVAKALGFDYWPAEGNISGPRGFTDIRNHIIYSGGSAEWFPHEFVHIYINPLFPQAHHYFLEGYATLLGGSWGHSLSWHIKRNWEYLRAHPETDVLTFKGVDLFVGPVYVIGGLLCKLAEEKGGRELIQKLMTYGKEDEDLYRAIHDVFGVSKDNVNNFLRNKLAEYQSD